MSYEEACRHPRTAYSEKTIWGRKWEYGWFLQKLRFQKADQGNQKFIYAVMPYDTTFYESDVIERAYELNNPAVSVIGRLKDRSWIRLSKKNVILETVKAAEDGSGDLILRLYECKNTYTSCQVTFGFEVKEAVRTNMLEEAEETVKVEGNTVNLTWKGSKIITLRVKR